MHYWQLAKLIQKSPPATHNIAMHRVVKGVGWKFDEYNLEPAEYYYSTIVCGMADPAHKSK